jgi:hypothetical protein
MQAIDRHVDPLPLGAPVGADTGLAVRRGVDT